MSIKSMGFWGSVAVLAIATPTSHPASASITPSADPLANASLPQFYEPCPNALFPSPTEPPLSCAPPPPPPTLVIAPGPLSQQAYTCQEEGTDVTGQYVPITGSGRLPLFLQFNGSGFGIGGALIHAPNLPLGTLGYSITVPNGVGTEVISEVEIVTSNGTFDLVSYPSLATITKTPNTLKSKGSGASAYISWNLAGLIPSVVPAGTTLQGVLIEVAAAPDTSSQVYLDWISVNGQSVPKITNSTLPCPLSP